MNYTPILVIKSDDTIDFAEPEEFHNLKSYFRNTKMPYKNSEINYALSWYICGNDDINKIGSLLLGDSCCSCNPKTHYTISGSICFHKYIKGNLEDFNDEDIKFIFEEAKRINEINKKKVMYFDNTDTNIKRDTELILEEKKILTKKWSLSNLRKKKKDKKLK